MIASIVIVLSSTPIMWTFEGGSSREKQGRRTTSVARLTVCRALKKALGLKVRKVDSDEQASATTCGRNVAREGQCF